jgi:hypothetical protein
VRDTDDSGSVPVVVSEAALGEVYSLINGVVGREGLVAFTVTGPDAREGAQALWDLLHGETATRLQMSQFVWGRPAEAPDVSAAPAQAETLPEAFYFRFGNLPPDERPFSAGTGEGIWGLAMAAQGLDYRDYREEGVSVFLVRRVEEKTYLLDCDGETEEGCLRRCFAMATRLRRPEYVAAGRLVGSGALGEPLLREVTLQPLPLDVVVTVEPTDVWVDAWNLWRLLDAEDPGRRTAFFGANYRAAYVRPDILEAVGMGGLASAMRETKAWT